MDIKLEEPDDVVPPDDVAQSTRNARERDNIDRASHTLLQNRIPAKQRKITEFVNVQQDEDSVEEPPP